MVIRPPCQPGDVLWVRETWDRLPVSPGGHFRPNGVYYYRADGDTRPEPHTYKAWHPSIHMHKEAARIFLRVTGVRPERLREMVLADLLMEGVREAGITFGTVPSGPVNGSYTAGKPTRGCG